jgi:hypothetical protein
MRVMDLALEDSHGSWINRWTAEQIVDVALKLNANVLNLLVVNEWGQAIWPSKHVPMRPELDGEDRLRAVADCARSAGLHLAAMWGPTASPTQVQRHPDWAVRDRNGRMQGWGVRHSSRCFAACMNSPFEDLVNQVLDELFSQYPVELLALDFYFQEPCWCSYCRKRCLDDTGIDVFAEPAPFGRENVHREWQEQRVAAQLVRMRDTIGKHDGALAHYRVLPAVDVIFTEPHTGDMLDLSDKGYLIARDRAEGRATGKPNVTCTPYAHGYNIGWAKPPVHMRQEFRVISAHGSSPWPVMWDWEILRDPRGLAPLGEAFAEMKSLVPLMAEARPLPHVALAFNRKGPLEGGDHADHGHGDAVKGFYDALSGAHIPFELIRDDAITVDALKLHSTLILPNLTGLDDAQMDAIRRFVADGGNLIATHLTSRFTREGWDRYDFGLAGVFGVRYLGAFDEAWHYVVPTGPHPVVAHLPAGLGIPHGDIWSTMRELREPDEPLPEPERLKAGRATDTGRLLKIEPDTAAEVIATVHDTRKPLGSYFIKDIVPAIPGRDTGYPAIVVNRFGRGRCVYFAGQPDRLFQRQGHPDNEQMLINAVKWLAGSPPVRVEAPRTVEATYWQRPDGGLLVHLINHTHDPVFPAPASATKVPASREVMRAIREVVPVRDVCIHLRDGATSATMLIGAPAITLSGKTITLERLDEYAVVEIKG